MRRQQRASRTEPPNAPGGASHERVPAYALVSLAILPPPHRGYCHSLATRPVRAGKEDSMTRTAQPQGQGDEQARPPRLTVRIADAIRMLGIG